MRWGWTAGLLLLMAVPGTTPVLAQVGGSSSAVAKALFDRGGQLYQAGELEQAPEVEDLVALWRSLNRADVIYLQERLNEERTKKQ